MPSVSPTRVLIVARQTADSPRLMERVAARAAAGPCRFTLLVPASFPPPLAANPKGRWAAEAERRLSVALPRLSEAAGEEVVGVIGAHDPLVAVQDALNLMGFDEVIVSMLAPRASRWLRLGLPGKIRALGVPVTVVTATPSASRRFPPPEHLLTRPERRVRDPPRCRRAASLARRMSPGSRMRNQIASRPWVKSARVGSSTRAAPPARPGGLAPAHRWA